MKTVRTLTLLAGLILPVSVLTLVGCDQKTAAPAADALPKKADEHVHKEGDGHDHAAADQDDHDHGARTQLGEQTVGDFTIKASRDGDIKPGSDAAINVWITSNEGKVAAVRFWIGTEDAKGSVKAKAELEKDNWHTHAEVPNTLPLGSRLWVEVESDSGVKTVAGFDLKA